METSLQSLKRIEEVIYIPLYDDLSAYLTGVRDIINLINNIEPSKDIADYIVEQVEILTKDLKD